MARKFERNETGHLVPTADTVLDIENPIDRLFMTGVGIPEPGDPDYVEDDASGYPEDDEDEK